MNTHNLYADENGMLVLPRLKYEDLVVSGEIVEHHNAHVVEYHISRARDLRAMQKKRTRWGGNQSPLRESLNLAPDNLDDVFDVYGSYIGRRAKFY